LQAASHRWFSLSNLISVALPLTTPSFKYCVEWNGNSPPSHAQLLPLVAHPIKVSVNISSGVISLLDAFDIGLGLLALFKLSANGSAGSGSEKRRQDFPQRREDSRNIFHY
jgi:hypothetical protein